MDEAIYYKVSGTSYSAPIAATMYTILYEAAQEISYATGISLSNEDILEALFIALENKDGKTVPKPKINSPMVLDYSKKFDIYNGYGCIDIFDAINYLGFLAMKRLSAGTYYVMEYTAFSVSVKVNVTLSYKASVTNRLRNRYSVKYIVYKYVGRWVEYSSGSLTRTYEGYGWDIWKATISFPPSPGGTKYKIKVYIYTTYDDIVLIGESFVNIYVLEASPW